MKMRLGGKISIALALVCGGLWTMLLLAPANAGEVQPFGGAALCFLSFPTGWLSGVFSGGHEDRSSQLLLYLLLMIPNFFLVGYSIGRMFHGSRRLYRFSRSMA